MKINKIDNAQNFKAVYRVKASPSNLKYFEEAVAPVYRSIKKAGIRAFFKNSSEMFALTGKDAHEFDKQYNQLKRNKLISCVSMHKPSDNVVQLPHKDNNFMDNFLQNKPIEFIDNFNMFLVKLFN